MPDATVAEAPFNKLDADIILRSSDAVDFRVRQGILAETSPKFEYSVISQHFLDIKPSRASATYSKKRKRPEDEGTPIITIAANSEALRIFLLFCYPGHNPDAFTCDNIYDVRQLAIEYNVEFIQDFMDDEWEYYAKEEPFHAYAVAFDHAWSQGVKTAARASLRRPMLTHPLPDYMGHMHIGDLTRLQNYHSECAAAALSVVPIWNSGKHIVRRIGENKCWSTCRNGNTRLRDRKGKDVQAPGWFIQAVQGLLDALRVRPCKKTLLDDSLLRKLSNASTRCCGPCRNNGHWDLIEFAGKLGDDVEGAVDQVRITMFYEFYLMKAEPCADRTENERTTILKGAQTLYNSYISQEMLLSTSFTVCVACLFHRYVGSIQIF